MGDRYKHQTGLRISVPDLLITHANNITGLTNEYLQTKEVHSNMLRRSSQLTEQRKEVVLRNLSKSRESDDNCKDGVWWDASDKNEQSSLLKQSQITGQGLLNSELINIGESKWSFKTATNLSSTAVSILIDDTLKSHTQFKDTDSIRPKLLRSSSAPEEYFLANKAILKDHTTKSPQQPQDHCSKLPEINVSIDQIVIHEQVQDIYDSDDEWSDISDNEMGQTESDKNLQRIVKKSASKNDDQIESVENCSKMAAKILPPPKAVKLWRIQKRYVKIIFKKGGNTRENLHRKRPSTRATIVSIHTQPSCLHCYLNFMYYLCVSTKRYYKNMPAIQKVTQTLQKCGFWIISISSIFYSLDLLKYHGIEFLWDGHLHDYVQLGFLLMYTITRIYFVALQGFGRLRINAAIRDMDKANCMSFNNNFWSPTTIAAILGGSSVLLAILGMLFGNIPFFMWSIDNLVKRRAYRVSHAVLVWSTTNYLNVTTQIYDNYDNKAAWSTLFIALPRFVWVFCGCLLDFALVDIFIASTLSLITIVDGFLRKIAKFKKATRQLAYCRFRREWEQFKMINRASESFGRTFGTLLTLVHVYNLLQFALFLRLILIKEAGTFGFISMAINVIKSMIIYVIAIQISDKNKACRHWVRQCVSRSLNKKNHRKFCMRTILMLDEMKENPLGLGRDEFFVNKGFLLAFLSLVASLFVMLVSNTKEATRKE